jgi:peptidoglycan hydrolase CwlO-like protein
MKHVISPTSFLLTILSSFLLVSCGDDPALVKKRQEQKLEIARLEGELTILNDQLKSIPADRSAELAEMKKKVDAQTQEIARLEEEIIQLEKSKRELEVKFEQYKKNYPISQ